MCSKVAAIIPTFNRCASLEIVLTCLENQKVDAKVIPIVVVDGSTDGTFEMLRMRFPACVIVAGDGNWWYTKCINEGMKEGLRQGAEYFLTLNDDVLFDDLYIANFFSTLREVSDAAIIGSASFTQSQPTRITFSGIRQIVGWRLKEVNYYKKFSQVDPNELSGIKPSVNLSGRGMFFKTELLSQLGFYDEKFPQYGSDTDFSYRAYKKGMMVLVSFDSKIYENQLLTSKGATYNNPTYKEYFKSFFNPYSVNSLKKTWNYYLKHGKPLLLPVYFLFVMFASLYVFFFKYRGKGLEGK